MSIVAKAPDSQDLNQRVNPRKFRINRIDGITNG